MLVANENVNEEYQNTKDYLHDSDVEDGNSWHKDFKAKHTN